MKLQIPQEETEGINPKTGQQNKVNYVILKQSSRSLVKFIMEGILLILVAIHFILFYFTCSLLYLYNVI